jgi:hypothetical protein
MKIGRVVRLLTDNNRKELFSGVDEQRKIIISIFYPAGENSNKFKQGLYMDLFNPCQEEFIKRFGEKKDLSGQKLSEDYLRSMKINTYNDIAICEKEILYPVIIYSPGLGMDRDCLIYNIERLVSEGYIVFTVGHIYDTDFTILPDRRIIEQSKHIENSTIEENEQLVDIRKEDIIFLLDELKILNREDEIIKEKLDLDKLGILGHSIGGVAVFRAAEEDTRIKAIVMLDGSLQIFNLSKKISEGKSLNTPLLNFRRGSIDYSNEMKKIIESNADIKDGEEFRKRIIGRHQTLIEQIRGQKELYEYLSGYKSFIKLKNSEHLTFTDWPVIFNREFVNSVLNIKEAHEIISDITTRFFNEFLCGIKDDYRNFINSNRCSKICVINENGESMM